MYTLDKDWMGSHQQGSCWTSQVQSCPSPSWMIRSVGGRKPKSAPDGGATWGATLGRV